MAQIFADWYGEAVGLGGVARNVVNTYAGD